jgi:hypothetical protein
MCMCLEADRNVLLPPLSGVRNMLVLSDGLPSSTVFALERYFPYADKVSPPFLPFHIPGRALVLTFHSISTARSTYGSHPIPDWKTFYAIPR